MTKVFESNIEATHLGKKSSYRQFYDPSVLVAVPRRLNREQYQIEEDRLPFLGVDVWHAYEFSFLLENGFPVVGILKIVYPCTSEFLVESKSLKLYLNSFNMSRYGQSVAEGVALTTAKVKEDLQRLLCCPVELSFFYHFDQHASTDFGEYEILEHTIDIQEMQLTHFTENLELLKKSDTGGEVEWGSHLLRSNCKITFQPDWGSIYLHMKAEVLPTPESFLAYLISLRNENHFHEEICEMVFKRLNDLFAPQELTVTCLYTRRGGIDINPVRSLNGKKLPEILINPYQQDAPVFRQ